MRLRSQATHLGAWLEKQYDSSAVLLLLQDETMFGMSAKSRPNTHNVFINYHGTGGTHLSVYVNLASQSQS